MLFIPQKGRWLTQHNLGTVGTVTPGTSLTTGGASSTKGTPVEIFASTNFDVCAVEIFAHSYFSNGADSRGCLDILIGTATESVLIPNLLMGACGSIAATDPGPKSWMFPLFIPAGSRIAAQVAGARISTAMYVWMRLYGGLISPPWRVGGKVETYGVGTVPNGTTITPGASGAEGAWTEITASSSRDHFCLVPSMQFSADTTTSSRGLMLDIGVGAATEEEVAQSFFYITSGSENMAGPFGGHLPHCVDVPSGSRLVMRVSSSGTVDGTQVALHGVS